MKQLHNMLLRELRRYDQSKRELGAASGDREAQARAMRRLNESRRRLRAATHVVHRRMHSTGKTQVQPLPCPSDLDREVSA